ncbi:S8 family serine peptidase [Geodermatophilus sp. SYSU D00079]
MGTTTGSGSVSRRRRALAVAAAATVGFSGAAVVDAFVLSPTPAMADELGPGDGLTRLVVQTAGGVGAEQLAALDALPAVDSAQLLSDGSALVAGTGITDDDMRGVVPGAEVVPSVPGEVAGATISDPYWSEYGWNLENTGSNAYRGWVPATAGADVSAVTGWQAGTGRGMVVAVVDSGYALSHPDMAGALWTNPDEPCGSADTDGNGRPGDCHGWNFYRNSPDVSNGGDNAHGTAVAGIVAARAGNGQGIAGVAPDATIMPLVIGGGASVDLVLGAEAIRYAVDNGADVVNASWGSSEAVYDPSDSSYGARLLSAAISYANSKGVVVVAAAGNDHADRDVARKYPASLDVPGLITVGSSTAQDTVAAHSAYGATTVDLFAPGEYVTVNTSEGGYNTLGAGTSYAAPHVAAAVALYKAQNRTAGAVELKTAVLDDVHHLAAFGGRSVTGGRLALDDLGNTAAPVSYVFSGLAADAGTVTPQVVATGSTPAGGYEVVLGLGMEHAGQLYALADHDITLDGVPATTDDNGEATFSLGHRSSLGSVVLSPTTELADGRYVLTAQITREGSPLGLAYAAPLLVGDEARSTAPQPGTQTPGTPVPDPDPDTQTPGTQTPGTQSPGTQTPGTQTPDTQTPGTQSPGTQSPGTQTPDTQTPGTQTPDTQTPGTQSPGTQTPDTHTPDNQTPGTPTPGTPVPAPDTPAPGTESPVAPTPDAPTPTPGTQTPDTETPGTQTPGTQTPGTQSPDTGDKKVYEEQGPYRLTSISPTRVSTAGGTQVTITGLAIPQGATVRVGATRVAQVSDALTTSSRVVFRTPAAVAGSYDVYVFGPDGETYSVLADGLTYVDADTPSTGGGTPDPGEEDPAPQTPGTQSPGTQTPGTQTPGTQTPGTQPPAGNGGIVTGPNGERLVHSTRFASLGSSIWGVNCANGCSGLSL